MRRETLAPRPDWQQLVEALRLDYHTADGQTYWNESACYQFTAEEVDEIEYATNQLESHCLDVVSHVIDKNMFEQLGITGDAIGLIQDSWKAKERHIYGRFDLSIDSQGDIKMLEYNADTPTSLLEAAVIQWQWLQQVKPGADQFNSIHERLISAWQRMEIATPLYFTATEDSDEDIITVSYLQDTAQQAGLVTDFIPLEDIGYDSDTGKFVDNRLQTIQTLFKLYPWEMAIHDEFAHKIKPSGLRMIEPAWKMILSNKGMLPLLYELFPDSPYILPASYTDILPFKSVRKPFFSREGANIAIMEHGRAISDTGGAYGEGRMIYQAYHNGVMFADGQRPIIGSWVIAGESAGMGIREDKGITTNSACFVPHYFEPAA